MTIRIKILIKRILDLPNFLFRYIVISIFFRKHNLKLNEFTSECLPDCSPIIIQGMFRSGTSLTSSIIHGFGVDFGKNEHLIQAIGRSKSLNPKGFYEHYLFAAISRYFHYITNSKGDDPPSSIDVEAVNWDSINWKKLIYNSVVRENDKRVSLKSKLEMWDELLNLGFKNFIEKHFSLPFAIKIPMLALFSHQILDIFPNALFIVVFRNPYSVVESAKRITKRSSFDLYAKYHSVLSNLDQNIESSKILFFSYDNLIDEPEVSINRLHNFINKYFNLASSDDLSTNQIDMNLFRNRPKNKINDLPLNVKKQYETMLDKL